MPDVVSTITVKVLGDVRGLTGALTAADGGLGGTVKKAAIAGASILAAKKTFDIIGDVLDQADRAGDATGRIVTLLGDADTQKLTDIADGFSDIGVSAPDFLEIAAGFTEFASASGKLTPDQITDMAGGVAEFAGALGRLKDVDPSTLGDDIANFISGSRGAAAAAKDLGLPFDAALTPAERYAQLMERLPGLMAEVTGANQGLDDKQSELNAKWETFGSEVGPTVEGALSGILDFTLDEIDALPHAIQGFQDLGAALEGIARTALGPLGNLRDLLEGILNLAGQVNANVSTPGSGKNWTDGNRSESKTVQDTQDYDERNGTTRSVNSRIGGP